ncbi:hypothetical protein SDC9_190888 [bioreactor metagenome]|uniref:Uncharacterized protein n=1 Tax=bioreactor metagenome TaxID=1076179 RepID=A0A645HYR4_9ZZZZ
MLPGVGFIRLTAFTRAKPGQQRGLRVRKEADIFTQRMFCRAGRSAKDAGRLHRKDKLSVSLRITFQHRLPALVVIYA